MVLEKRHVFMNLLFEGLKRWEFLLGAEVMHERDGHLSSVEVAIPCDQNLTSLTLRKKLKKKKTIRNVHKKKGNRT